MKAIIALMFSVGIFGSPVVNYRAEKETKSVLYYREDRKLRWSDFSVVGSSQKYAAEISCKIDIEVQSEGENVTGVDVFCYMSKGESWVAKGQMNDRVLNHEQGHFDIAYKFSRLLIERLKTVKTEKQIFDVYDNVVREYEKCQRDYDGQTNHGLNFPQQEKWDDWIRGN